jgi:hypothetical protein
MDDEEFWTLIDQSRSTSPSITEGILVAALATLPVEEIEAFNLHWLQALFAAYSWNLVGAAFLLDGGVAASGS